MRLPGRLSARGLVIALLGAALALVFVMPFVVPTPRAWIGSRTPATEDVIDLYWAMFWIAAVILIIVEGGIIAAAVLFRERPGHQAHTYHGNTLLEFTWTIIPAIIVLGLSAYSFKSLSALTDTERDAKMTIEVIGRQWQWTFRYPDGLQVNTEAHIPVNTKVRLTITSVDVIHSFWIPKISGKMDAVPGFKNAIWVHAIEPGEYLGQCTEFCGLGHADMLAKVVAEPQADFERWLVEERKRQEAGPGGDQIAAGQQIAQQTCVVCHSFDKNRTSPNTAAPNLGKYGSEGPFSAQLKALKNGGDRDWLKKWVSDAKSIKPGTAMPTWLNTAGGTLTGAQIDSVVAYLMSLK